jgi:hypothetical protein
MPLILLFSNIFVSFCVLQDIEINDGILSEIAKKRKNRLNLIQNVERKAYI